MTERGPYKIRSGIGVALAGATDAQIAWAAGLFEGEGCITTNKRRGQVEGICLALGMTDLDVVQRYADICVVGTRELRPRQEQRIKKMYVHRISVPGDCIEVLDAFMPYFGARRAARALDVVVQVIEAGYRMQPRGDAEACSKGHLRLEFAKRNKKGHWVCLKCASAWQRSNRERIQQEQLAAAG